MGIKKFKIKNIGEIFKYRGKLLKTVTIQTSTYNPNFKCKYCGLYRKYVIQNFYVCEKENACSPKYRNDKKNVYYEHIGKYVRKTKKGINFQYKKYETV